jgi:hypothetical protein
MLRSIATAGVFALVAVLTGACGADEGAPSSAEQPTPSSAKPAVLHAYKAYWRSYLRALDPPRPHSAQLRAHATGTELAKVRQVIAARKGSGQVVRGRYGHRAEVDGVADGRATVRDCLTLRTAVYDARSGRKVQADQPGPFSVTVAMVKQGERWKVEEVSAGNASCAGPPASGAGPSASSR